MVDAADFLLLQRALEANHGDPSFFTRMPPSALPGYPGTKKKYCLCCGITIYASDQPLLNAGWANGEPRAYIHPEPETHSWLLL